MAYSVLTALYFLIGAYALAAQVYFIRELLVVFFGNELCLGVVFAAWFAGVGFGARTGGWIGAKIRNQECAFVIHVLILALLPLVLIPCMRCMLVLFDVEPGAYASLKQMLSGAALALCPFSFMVGLLFPLACRILIRDRDPDSGSIGWIYVWESVGSLVGGFLISFVLIPRIAPMVVFAWGALLMCVCCLLYVYSQADTGRMHWLKAVLMLFIVTDAVAVGSGGWEAADRYLNGIRWKTFHSGLRIVDSADSRYQHIVLAEGGGQYSLYSNGLLVSSFPDAYQSSLKAHFYLCQHPAPGQVLMIGETSGGFIREVLKHPVESVTCIELDPTIPAMVRPYLTSEDSRALRDERVTFSYMDGRRYVKETFKRYDLVMVHVPDPATALLNRYFTIEFFREVRNILNEGGVFIIGMSSTEHYIDRQTADYNASIFRGFVDVFPYVVAVPGERNHFIASTRKGAFSSDPSVLTERYQERRIVTRHFTPELFTWIVQQEKIDFLQQKLFRSEPPPLNRDFHPITYYLNLVLWENIFGERGVESILDMLYAKRVRLVFVVMAIIAMILFLLLCKKDGSAFEKYSICWVIGSTGYAGMALELILLFMFQNFYGYIYKQIGIIIALFMIGIALGSCGMRWYLNRCGGAALPLVRLLEAGICIYCLVVPLVLYAFAGSLFDSKSLFFSMQYLFYILILVIGLFVGLEFPLACHLLIGAGHEGGRVAGWIDAADHAGACFGAFLTGILFVPLVGVYASCFIAAGLKVFSLVLLWRQPNN